MAVYRPARKFVPHPAILVLIILAVLAVIILLLVNTKPALAPENPLNVARPNALDAANGLDVFNVEYPKVLQGQTSGAGPALSRAETAWKAAEPAFKTLDPDGTAQLDADFATLDAKVQAKAPADEVTTLSDSIRQRLLALGNAQGAATEAGTQNAQ
ncbi:MAG TPA: hypothetical protein VKQ72_06050 [Aggregatilineales bacterium]|nr:hypothetical protein [Aggregatilineales bacterium]